MRFITATGTVAILLLAGCLGNDAQPAATLTSVAEMADTRPTINLEVTDDVLAPRDLQAPPQWKTGEWWQYKLVDDFTGASTEVTRVVAGTDGDDFLVGMPAMQFRHDIMVLHMPGFGQVSRANLSFEVHDARFAPLKFPIKAGDTYPTEWEGQPTTVTVVTAADGIATLEATNPQGGDNVQMTYNAEVGEITKLVMPGYATYEIVGHGFDFNGVMTVPHQHDLIFVQQRIGVPLGVPQGGEPVLTTDAVNVDPTYDRVSFAIIAGSLPSSLITNALGLPDVVPVDPPQGYYKETATAPDGETFEVEILPTDTPGLKISFFGKDMPGGDWRFDHLAAGPGIVLTEGIAYHVYDVELPSGRILPSMGEHAHGG